MDKIVIDSDVPMPEYRRGGSKYPFSAMKVGDSLFCERNSFRSRVTHYVRHYNPTWKFTIRKEGDGYRCWRVK